MEEGLAEYFGGVESGVAEARADRLRRNGLTQLHELAKVVKGSASYQDREAALQFYAQSWALAHLLLTDPAYRAGAWTLVELLDQGESLESAAEWVYGRGLTQLHLDLETHLGRLKAGPAVARPAPRAAVTVAAAADEVGLALARLLLRKSDISGAQRLLDRLAESSRGNPELWSLAGDLALKQGRPSDARFALREALRLGSRDARGLRQLAVLEQNAMNRAGLEPVLERLAEVDPSGHYARRALPTLQAPR
jgi:tetratricopeptide (TPR) repeat protein